MAISCCLNDLPDCVLLKVFKQLQSKVDIWRSRNVCIRWYNLLRDSELWRVCNLSKFRFDNITLIGEIRKCVSLHVLQYLEVHNKVITMDVLSVILETANQLNGLRLNGCTVKPGSMKLPYVLKPPYHTLKYLDVRSSGGNFAFMEAILIQMGSSINVLGLSNNFGRFSLIRGHPFAYYVRNLKMLECYDCTWVNDETLDVVSQYCPNLESLNVTKCLNIQGTTLHKVLTKCKDLKSLILRRTSIREEELLKPTWKNLKIEELDISCCYYLNDESVNKMIGSLAEQLQYLCCAVNDELILNLMPLKKPLKFLELRRRHHVDLNAIARFISTCDNLEGLDISLAPIEYELFTTMLPSLPNLRWLSIAGHDVLNTNLTLDLLSAYNNKIEGLQINFYQATSDENLVAALHSFILYSPKLKKICIEGSYMQDIVSRINSDIQTDSRFEKVTVEFCKPCDFTFPLPHYNINRFAEKFSQKPSTFNFSRNRRKTS